MKIAVVGASGLVGRKILKLLGNKYEIDAFCSSRSEGLVIEGHTLKKLTQENIDAYDFALFSAGSDVSKKWAENFIKKGATVIDNSNAFRRNKNVPLIVPEININTINKSTKIIANPNCSTIQLALPLYHLNKVNKIKKVIVSTYQSASGAGQKGLDDLNNKTTNKFPYILYDELIPQIDTTLKNGYTLEEDKIVFELRKILNLPKLKVTATAVRVPIQYCHGESVHITFKHSISVDKVKSTLENARGITVLDNTKENIYPLTSIAKNTNNIYVGRIRKDLNQKNSICMWIVADNLMKGASANAIQILKALEGV